MPDHGTTPTRRIVERRTQMGVLDLEVPLVSGVDDSGPWRADLVSARALGKKRTRRGPTGAARSEERREPPVVMVAWRMVAGIGGSKIPVRMFCAKVPRVVRGERIQRGRLDDSRGLRRPEWTRRASISWSRRGRRGHEGGVSSRSLNRPERYTQSVVHLRLSLESDLGWGGWIEWPG